MGRPAAGALELAPSLQSGLAEDPRRALEAQLGAWLPALKWLLKEFRLRVGYETPDEEAGVRFWMDRYERLRGGLPALALEDQAWSWPTADEPGLPALPAEARQASRWPREALERRLAQLFDLRRRHCPDVPVLVPLAQLQHYELPRGLTAERRRAALHQRPRRACGGGSVPGGGRAAAPRGAGARAPAGPAARALSLECRVRLSPSGGGRPPLSDDELASRLVDLAIECDGVALRASGPHGGEASGATPRRWCEGRSRLQDLQLLSFWAQLKDKAAHGLLVPAGRAERVLAERVSGAGFASAVFRLFWTRFRYECLDAGTLYRFWLSMPTAVRSAHCVRGVPDDEAFELLRVEAQARAEKKRCLQAAGVAATPTPHAAGRLPWRPGGEALTAVAAPRTCLKLASTSVKGTGLWELSRPKSCTTALPFLKALARRFSEDPVMQRMLRQSLDGDALRRGMRSLVVHEAYSMVHDMDLLRCVSTAGRSPEQDRRPVRQQASLRDWLSQDSERAQQALQSLKDVQEITTRINRFLRREAARYLERAKPLGQLSMYFPERHRGHAGLSGLLLIDDLFARLCRQLGTAEVLARFEVQGATGGKMRLPGNRARPDSCSIPSSDCATRRAACRASSAAPGCAAEDAVDGKAASGWRPEPCSQEAKLGGAWWLADLGRQQSCTGLVLEWHLSRRTRAVYPNRFHLRDDLVLGGGFGSPIVVAHVRPGGVAARAGVVPGDRLQLGAGGDGDGAFCELSPAEALAGLLAHQDLQRPATLVFEGPGLEAGPGAGGPGPPLAAALLLAASASRDGAQGSFEALAGGLELRAAPGEACRVPGPFVGRWVRLDFPGPWPCVDGRPLLLSVRVLRAWRLAPPAFRRRFVEALKERARDGGGRRRSAAPDPTRGRRPFWADSSRASSCNLKISRDVHLRRQRHHDCESDEEENLLKLCKRDRKEFNSLQSTEVRKLRQRIFALDDEVRECTFHPRSGGKVPAHVHELREHVTDRLDAETGIDDFVKNLGENFESGAYPNYRLVRRRMALQRARNEFSQGNLSAALTRLQGQFQIQQIHRRFRCFHRGCGKPLDQSAELCGCGGFYCEAHRQQAVHRCSEMKKRLVRLAQEAKERDSERRERGEEVLPEEKFDNKAELGLLLEVYALSAQVLGAQRTRELQRRSLARLGHSLEHFGAVRLLERPFRRRMCRSAFGARGHLRGAAGPGCCSCPNAHHPSELRFPAGESSRRRSAWVAAALAEAEVRADALPGSEAERAKVLGRAASRPRSQPPPRRGHGRPRRARSEPRRRGGAAAGEGARGPAPGPAVGAAAPPVAPEGAPPAAAAPAGGRAGLAEQILALAGQGALAPGPGREPQEPRGGGAGAGAGAAVECLGAPEAGLARVADAAGASGLDGGGLACGVGTFGEARWWQVGAAAPLAPPPKAPTPALRPPDFGGRCEAMCAELLELGTCSQGRDCPFAHRPDELAPRYTHGLESARTMP